MSANWSAVLSTFAKGLFVLFVLFDTVVITLWFASSENGFLRAKFMPIRRILMPDYMRDVNDTQVEYMEPLDTRKVIIFLITPTKTRLEQKADLTRLSQTLKLVKNVHWILIEDSGHLSQMVENILKRSRLPYTHLAVRSDGSIGGKGMAQRNAGLDWLRTTFIDRPKVKGVVFFADDDNSYDVRLFDQYIRKVKNVGIWAVGLVGGVKVESPIVVNGRVTGWDVGWNPGRSFATDMAGFAVNLKTILSTNASFHKGCNGQSYEPCFLDQLNISKSDLEPFGFEKRPKEILVWHTKTGNGGSGGDEKGYIV